MKADFVPEMTPLGPRLAAAARALGAAKLQAPAWLAPLAEVLARIDRAAGSLPDRFVRVEATGLRRVDAEATAPAAAEGEPLPDGVRQRLRSDLGPAADHVRVHDDEAAHALARRHDADAVAVGADVFFARDRYQPHDSAGFALLAHETVHVQHAQRPDAAWQRTGAPALAAEEAMALAVERAQRPALPGASPRASPGPAVASFPPIHGGAAPAVPAAHRPMTAAADRALAAPAAPGVDMDALRQALMRDLLQQIRADMERGG
jgi:hypothetical protein